MLGFIPRNPRRLLYPLPHYSSTWLSSFVLHLFLFISRPLPDLSSTFSTLVGMEHSVSGLIPLVGGITARNWLGVVFRRTSDKKKKPPAISSPDFNTNPAEHKTAWDHGWLGEFLSGDGGLLVCLYVCILLKWTSVVILLRSQKEKRSHREHYIFCREHPSSHE